MKVKSDAGARVAPSHWGRVWVAYLAGCFGAFHIGKVVAALPLLIEELDLSLSEAGWLLSLFTLVSACVGVFLGLLADRFGPARLAVSGLCIAAAGSWAGSVGESFSWLLAFRLLEGLGFILTIVCCPSLISRSVTDADRPLAMGLWGSFIPVGVSVSMLATPLVIELQGWRVVWVAVGVGNLLWAILLLQVFGRRKNPVAQASLPVAELIAPIRRGGPLMLVVGFACYSALYQAVTALLPTMLVSGFDMLLANAALLGAFVVMANLIGNVGAGWLVGRGVPPWLLQVIAFVSMGLTGSLMFMSFTEPLTKLLLGIVFSVCGGMFPGTAFVLAARFSATPALVAVMAGLLLQGSGFGQMMGPLVTTAMVDFSGDWAAAIPGFIVVTLLGLGSALVIKRVVS